MILFWCPPGVCRHPSIFSLSLCNLLVHNGLPYIRWKGTYIALIWCILAHPVQSICRDIKVFKDSHNRPSYNWPSTETTFQRWFCFPFLVQCKIAQNPTPSNHQTSSHAINVQVFRNWNDAMTPNLSASSLRRSLFKVLPENSDSLSHN